MFTLLDGRNLSALYRSEEGFVPGDYYPDLIRIL